MVSKFTIETKADNVPTDYSLDIGDIVRYTVTDELYEVFYTEYAFNDGFHYHISKCDTDELDDVVILSDSPNGELELVCDASDSLKKEFNLVSDVDEVTDDEFIIDESNVYHGSINLEDMDLEYEN